MNLLLSTLLTGNVLERHFHLVALLVYLRFALADVEDTTASSASHPIHDEEPEADDENPWCYVYKDVNKAVSALCLVAEVALEDTFVTLLLDETLYLVYAAVLHLHKGILAGFLHALLEYLSYMFRFDVHL